MKKINYILLGLAITAISVGCKKDKIEDTTSTPTYSVPTTYDFTNVNYEDQKKLLLMADQIGAAINVGNTAGKVVSAQQLKDMLNNINGYFNDSLYQLNASGLRLADYCPADGKSDLYAYFDSIGAYSQSTVAASHGVAGVGVSSANASKKLLLSPNGVFYSQLVKKTFQGIFAYQIANVYLKDSIASTVDNNAVIEGSGTAMEHHWDEAFGFFGVPVTFPATTKGSKYYGAYSNQVDPGLHSNVAIMNAFLKGRAAISNKDMGTKQAQATLLINLFDKLAAACVVQEMKETEENIDAGDAVAAYGTMSETLGFIRTMKYLPQSARIITDAQIRQLEAMIDAKNPDSPDLYIFIDASGSSAAQIKAKTDAIRQFIGNVYGFSAADLALM